jgi:hypothetical protein
MSLLLKICNFESALHTAWQAYDYVCEQSENGTTYPDREDYFTISRYYQD